MESPSAESGVTQVLWISKAWAKLGTGQPAATLCWSLSEEEHNSTWRYRVMGWREDNAGVLRRKLIFASVFLKFPTFYETLVFKVVLPLDLTLSQMKPVHTLTLFASDSF